MHTKWISYKSFEDITKIIVYLKRAIYLIEVSTSTISYFINWILHITIKNYSTSAMSTIISPSNNAISKKDVEDHANGWLRPLNIIILSYFACNRNTLSLINNVNDRYKRTLFLLAKIYYHQCHYYYHYYDIFRNKYI